MRTMKRLALAVVTLAILTGCSSGPSPMQQWEAGPGGQTTKALAAALDQITTDANTTGEVSEADAGALGRAADSGYQHCPLVDCAEWKQAMQDYLAASIGMTLANTTGNTGDDSAAATEIANATAIMSRLAGEWGVKL